MFESFSVVESISALFVTIILVDIIIDGKLRGTKKGFKIWAAQQIRQKQLFSGVKLLLLKPIIPK
jgi:hypothetical protein